MTENRLDDPANYQRRDCLFNKPAPIKLLYYLDYRFISLNHPNRWYTTFSKIGFSALRTVRSTVNFSREKSSKRSVDKPFLLLEDTSKSHLYIHYNTYIYAQSKF